MPRKCACQRCFLQPQIFMPGFRQTNFLRDVGALLALVFAEFRHSVSSRADAFFQLSKLVFELAPERID